MMPGWATVAAFIEGVNELELRNIPLLAEEGNVATLIRCCKASFVGADGVVSFGEMFRPKVSPIWPPRLRGIGGFASSLTAHPPLLAEEGNVARFNSFSCS